MDFCSRNLTSYDRPSTMEVIVPPVLLTLLIIAGLLGLVLVERRRTKRSVQRHYGDGYSAKTMPPDESRSSGPQAASVVEHIIGEGNFMSEYDYEVLREMDVYYNQPKQLLLICVPALLSLAFTALIMFLFEPLVRCLWPSGSGMRPSTINAAIACFLSPAGLVYALSFGFTFQQALEKNSSTLRKVTEELSLMDQMITMITHMNLPTQRHVMAMCKAIKSEVIFMSMLVQNREAHTFSSKAPTNIKVHVWSVLDVLRDAADHPEYMFNVNSILVDKLLTYLLMLNSICTDRLGSLHTRIHPLMWLFLEVLGSLVLLGVIFIDAKSRRMELALCELTIFSVSMLCYVLADLDSPFNGFFRVDLGVLPDVIRRIEYAYNQAKTAAATAGGEGGVYGGVKGGGASEYMYGGYGGGAGGEDGMKEFNVSEKGERAWDGKRNVSTAKGLKKRVAPQEEEGGDTALRTLGGGETPRGKQSTGPGAHGVIAVTHSGRRSALSLETTLTDIQ